jgi:DnaA family protein
MQQLPLHVRLRDAARFANFVPGHNLEVLEALTAPAAAGQRVVWLWGRAGTGKTHLLQATCAAASADGLGAAYLDLHAAPASGLLDGLDTLDVVCLDGLDAVAADPDWNAALFRLYTLTQDGSGRLVVASAGPPAGLPLVLPDLRSRLLAGSVYQLVELDETGQCAALQRRAAASGLELTPDAALYLVHRLPRDMHSLFAVLDELDRASLAAQRRLTIPFLREALESRQQSNRALEPEPDPHPHPHPEPDPGT